MSPTRIRCKIFATDLDGTVLVDGGPQGAHMPPRTKQALNALHASGVMVVLASGRMHESMRAIADSLDFRAPIISYNGAMIRDAADALLYHQPVDLGVSGEVVDWAEAQGLPLNFYHAGRVLSRRFQPWWDLYEGRTSSPMLEVQSLAGYRDKLATKLLLLSEPARIKEFEAQFKESLAGRAHVLITADEYLEFMALGVDKGTALQRLAKELGVLAHEIVAAGDGTNDLEMLRYAGTALAIANGRQAAKDAADHIVAPPHEGGVADFIEKYLL